MNLWKTCFVIISAIILASDVYADWDYSRIEVHETSGIARESWPVQAGIAAPDDVSGDSLVLVQVEEDGTLRDLKFQLVEEIDSPGYDERGGRRFAGVKMFEIAFIAELPAGSSREFRLYYSAPGGDIAPSAELPQLDIEFAEGLSRTIKTGNARFEFHPDSGQMIKYELAGTGYAPELLRERNNPVHGSADLRTSRNNVRFWDIEDEDHDLIYKESAGPVTWQAVRSGYMPYSGRQIKVSASYTVFAGMPFLFTTTHIKFEADRLVSGLRNNQLVFDRGFHTHGIYMSSDGELVTARAFIQDDPNTYFADLGLGMLPPDIPFIGMLHEDHGYGIGLVTLDRASQRTGRLASPQTGGAHYHFLDSQLHGIGSPRNFFYLIRYESCYVASGKAIAGTALIPYGSVYSSESAILTYPVGGKDDDNRFDEVKRWIEMLRNPPSIHISIQQK